LDGTSLLFVVGAVAVLHEILVWINRALELGEHTEFIVRHIGEIKKVWNVLSEPAPMWASIPILILGLLFIWLDLRPREDNGRWFHTNDEIFDPNFELVSTTLMKDARSAASDKRDAAWKKVVDDLYERLKGGTLIAKAAGTHRCTAVTEAKGQKPTSRIPLGRGK